MIDTRTLMPGRDAFYTDMTGLLRQIDAAEQALVLLNIEIGKLEFILRTFGPDERDLVIREIGQRIGAIAPAGSRPYHISQSRFALVLSNPSYQQTIRHAQALVADLSRSFVVAGVSFHLEVHVGISNYPNHARSISELVRTAAFACHQASESRSDYATFDQKQDEWERHRFRLLTDLEQALQQQGGIQLAYQPLIRLETGDCEGMEGLCRWDHPEFGAIPPGHFLPYVEQTPLMMPLTEATLGIGLESLAQLGLRGFEGSLGINLSPGLFRHPDLLQRIEELFRFHNVAPGRVYFEITETGIMEHPNRAMNTLQELRNWGCKIAVDDFGTGHSSLAWLADLPIDTIKIDRHFIQNLARPGTEAIISATAMLAEKLGLKSVAEGIEEPEQLRKCRDLGVTYGQGYLIGRPMFRQDFAAWIGGRREQSLLQP